MWSAHVTFHCFSTRYNMRLSDPHPKRSIGVQFQLHHCPADGPGMSFRPWPPGYTTDCFCLRFVSALVLRKFEKKRYTWMVIIRMVKDVKWHGILQIHHMFIPMYCPYYSTDQYSSWMQWWFGATLLDDEVRRGVQVQKRNGEGHCHDQSSVPQDFKDLLPSGYLT